MVEQTVTIRAILEDLVSRRLTTIGSGFNRLVTDIRRVQTRLSPVLNRFTALAAGAVSVAGARQSLQLAERQVQAEANLLQALRGRTQEFDRIAAAASDLQQQTTQGDEAIIETAALLTNMGVAGERLNDALAASVDTAAALNVPVEQVAKAIGLFEIGRAGELGERIAQLKVLQAEGRLAQEGVETLLELFGGTGAALAQTDFGESIQQTNRLGDTLEVVGGVLIQIKNAALEPFIEGLEQLVDTLDTPEFQNFLEILLQILPVVTQIGIRVAQFLAILAGAKLVIFVAGILSSLVAVASTLIPLVATIATIAGAVGSIGVILLDVFGVLDNVFVIFNDIISLFEPAFEAVQSIFRAFSDGQISVESLFDLLGRRIAEVATLVQGFILDPFITVITAIRDFAVNAIRLPFDQGRLLVLLLADFTQRIFLRAIRGIVGAFDDVVNGVINGLNELPGVDIEFRANAENAVPAEFIELTAAIGRADDRLNETQENLRSIVPNALAEIAEANNAALASIAAQEQEFNQAFEDAVDSKLQAELQAAQEAVDAEIAKNARIVAETEAAAAQIQAIQATNVDAIRNITAEGITDLVSTLDAETGGIVQGLILNELDRQLRNGQISLQEFFDRRREVELGFIEEQLAQQQVLLDQRNDVLFTLENERTVIQDLVAQKQAELDAAVELGASEQERQQILEELQALLAQETELSGQILENKRQQVPVEAQIRDLKLQQAETEQQIADAAPEGFLDGLRQGAIDATSAFTDLSAAGQFVAQNVIADLSSGLVDVFVKGSQSFDDFLTNFLAGVGEMLIQIALLNALNAAFGGGGATGGLGSLAAGAEGGLWTGSQFVHRFGRGGSVPGPNVRRDVTPALLMPREYVSDRDTVDFYGVNFFKALKRRLIPRDLLGQSMRGGVLSVGKTRLATGGAVTGGGPDETARVETTLRAEVVADEQQFDRQLASGRGSMFRFMRENRDTIRSILQ